MFPETMTELFVKPGGNHFVCSGCNDICIELTEVNLICFPPDDFLEMQQDPTSVLRDIEPTNLATDLCPDCAQPQRTTHANQKRRL